MVRMSICVVASLFVLLGGCGSSSFSRHPAGWRSIELRDGLAGQYDAAWQTTVDTLARTYDLEIIDKDSGYMRTAWKFGIVGQSASVLAGRITVKFPSVSTPQTVDIKTDAQQFNRWSETWEAGFDSEFEREVMTDLQGRLGRTVQ